MNARSASAIARSASASGMRSSSASRASSASRETPLQFRSTSRIARLTRNLTNALQQNGNNEQNRANTTARNTGVKRTFPFAQLRKTMHNSDKRGEGNYAQGRNNTPKGVSLRTSRRRGEIFRNRTAEPPKIIQEKRKAVSLNNGLLQRVSSRSRNSLSQNTSNSTQETSNSTQETSNSRYIAPKKKNFTEFTIHVVSLAKFANMQTKELHEFTKRYFFHLFNNATFIDTNTNYIVPKKLDTGKSIFVKLLLLSAYIAKDKHGGILNKNNNPNLYSILEDAGIPDSNHFNDIVHKDGELHKHIEMVLANRAGGHAEGYAEYKRELDKFLDKYKLRNKSTSNSGGGKPNRKIPIKPRKKVKQNILGRRSRHRIFRGK